MYSSLTAAFQAGTLGSSLVVIVLAGCSGTAQTGVADAGTTAQTPDAQASPLSASDTSCEAYEDQTPPPDVRAISIVNTGERALYVTLTSHADCGVSFVDVRRDGQEVHFDGRCVESCQHALQSGWSWGGEGYTYDYTATCDCVPPARWLVELGPGQTMTEPARLEVAFQRMPRGCADGITTDAVNCFSMVVPQPGSYTLTVHAGLAPECVPSAQSCDCAPDATGACTNPDVRVSDAHWLEFSVERPRYFENQTIEISAPAE